MFVPPTSTKRPSKYTTNVCVGVRVGKGGGDVCAQVWILKTLAIATQPHIYWHFILASYDAFN